MLPGERKSVESIAALKASATPTQHRSLLHFIGGTPWSNEAVLAKVRAMVLSEIERRGPIEV